MIRKAVESYSQQVLSFERPYLERAMTISSLEELMYWFEHPIEKEIEQITLRVKDLRGRWVVLAAVRFDPAEDARGPWDSMWRYTLCDQLRRNFRRVGVTLEFHWTLEMRKIFDFCSEFMFG
jgi:hypothetical protein